MVIEFKKSPSQKGDVIIFLGTKQSLQKFLRTKGIHLKKGENNNFSKKVFYIGDNNVIPLEVKKGADHYLMAGGQAIRLSQKFHCERFHLEVLENLSSEERFSLRLGLSLGTYRFDSYQEKKEEENKIFFFPEGGLGKDEKKLTALKEAIFIVRNLINEPPSVLNPVSYAKKVPQILKGLPIHIKVFDDKELTRLKMEAMLAVGRAGANLPRMVRLHFNGGGKKKPVALIGKGVTFDSGGLSIKTSSGMMDMKMDMSGSATVLGIIYVLAKIKARVNVVGYMGLVENMPGSRAVKPGDIVRAYSGKTIEILNTDAEGRLVLADCLAYALRNDKPRFMVDFATLTGACMVALGQNIGGLFSNHENLSQALKKSFRKAGEKVWELPLEEDYEEDIKSKFATIKNIGNRYGGAITAALFLKHFVGDTPWAHLDIAGPAYIEKDRGIHPPGGTGYALPSLVDFLIEEDLKF